MYQDFSDDLFRNVLGLPRCDLIIVLSRFTKIFLTIYLEMFFNYLAEILSLYYQDLPRNVVVSS